LEAVFESTIGNQMWNERGSGRLDTSEIRKQHLTLRD
jgi:hypothetical protein